MSANILFNFLARPMFLGIAALYAGSAYSAYSADKEDLDVNLNPIYLSAKSHRNDFLQSDVVVQIPFALTRKAEDTGLGPIGAIAYFDNKELVHIRKNRVPPSQDESAVIRGLGRFYYVVSAHDTTHTFIPYLTLYRELVIDYRDVSGQQAESKFKTLLPPGFMYAYRMNDTLVLHFDAEMYSYKMPGNNMMKLGASYALADKWLVSASYERLAWDMKNDVNKNVSMNGVSNSVYLKLINSNPLRNNFSIIMGYAADRNATGSGLQPIGANRSNGFFWGGEITLGTLAW